MLRLHELLLIIVASILPIVASTAWYAAFGMSWWLPVIAPATFPISLGLIWLVGYMIDHTYG